MLRALITSRTDEIGRLRQECDTVTEADQVRRVLASGATGEGKQEARWTLEALEARKEFRALVQQL